jgi:hypothetical protein
MFEIRRALVAFVMASAVAAAGCLGDDGEAGESTEPAPTPAIGAFAELEERPLDLPRVQVPDDATSAERSFRRVAGNCFEWGAPDPGGIVLRAIGEAALGPFPGRKLEELERGPVYAALPEGAPRIVFLSALRASREARWWTIRTLWISRPTYDGPVLVRGGRLDRAGPLGFGSPVRPRRELRLPAASTWPSQPIHIPPGWRVSEIPTLIRGTGCYAFQVDAPRFSYVLAFGVQR